MQKTIANILLAATGFACFLALNSFSLWGFALLPETALGENAQLLWSAPLSLSNMLTFFVFVIGAYCAPTLFNRSPLPAAAALLTAAVTLMGLSTLTQNPAVLISASTCMGIGTTCCFFCWARALFADGSDLAKIELVLGSVLSAVPYLAFFTLEPSAIAVTIAVLAACNVAALFSHQRLANRENRSHVPQRTVSFGTLLATFWKPLLCIAMIGLAAPAIVVISHDSTASMTFVQQSLMVHSENIIAALVLGIAWLGARRETTPTKTFSVLFPIIATALLLFLVLEPPLRIIVPYVSGIAFVVFSMIVMIDSIEVSSKQNLGLTSVYGLFSGLFYCANWLGNFAMEAVREQGLLQEATVTIAVVALLYGCSIVMFFVTRAPREASSSNADKTCAPQEAIATETPVEVSTPIDLIDENCRRIAETHGLSKRQAEVFALLAHGYDIPTIAKKLYVSENTVRTHAKKIYATLEVHSKQEIIELSNASYDA